jgi:hypothetical protein
MRRTGLLALLIAVLVACSTGKPAHPGEEPVSSTEAVHRCDAPPFTAALIQSCLDAGREAAACIQPAIAVYLQTHTTKEALATLQCFADADAKLASSCHPISHAIGRETFVVHKTIESSFAACNQTCISGCFHGVMERFLRGDDASGDHISLAELQAKVATACDPNLPIGLKFQCLHGLGHAVEYYTGYQLRPSLLICDSPPDDWSRSSCAGGVFMENIVAANPDDRDLSATDPQYPCDAVEDHYKEPCYLIQTSRMSEMGLTPAQIFVECRNAGTWKGLCLESLGRDTSVLAVSTSPRAASSICEMGVGDERDSCTNGVVKSLSDITWDGRYSLPYCASYTSADAITYCFKTTIAYLEDNFAHAEGELATECATYVPGDADCVAALTR